MNTFVAVDDNALAQRIGSANRRVVLVAPGVSSGVAEALGQCFAKPSDISVTVVLDSDDEAYRIGYGDREGLECLQDLVTKYRIAVRSQQGVRIGLLLTDEDVLIWSPTPRAVEGQRKSEEPNGLIFKAESGGERNEEFLSLSTRLAEAVGSDDSDVLPSQAEIGRVPLTPDKVAETVKLLQENPPAPFDLARKTRVFSTKFQFVEFELRGAEWTKREVKLSNLLLNPDVPENLQGLLETHVKPFSQRAGVKISVPVLVQGQLAFDEEGKQFHCPMTQVDIEKTWKKLRDQYLKRIQGFGWLVDRTEKERFVSAVGAFETVLKSWVEGFRKTVESDDELLVKSIVALVKGRASQAKDYAKVVRGDLEEQIRRGIQNLSVIKPNVKLVFKDIAWESTRDKEFTEALREALPATDWQEWFETFTAARERGS